MVVVYMANILLPGQNIYGKENEMIKTDNINKAIEWLVSQQNEDGSWGKNNYKLYTYEVLKALQENDEQKYTDIYQKGINWATEQKEENTDYLARKAMISELCQEQDVNRLLNLQNSDGGFGISANFESDIWDTLLSLEVLLQKDNISEEIIKKGLLYIMEKQQEDGSFAFETSKQASVLLTAQVILVFHQYIQKNNNEVFITVQEVQRKAAEYLMQVSYQENNSVAESIAFIQAYRALLKVKGSQYTENLEQRLYQMQLENGSICDDIYAAALYIEAVRERESMPHGMIESMELFSVREEQEEKTNVFYADEYLKYVIKGECEEGTELNVFITNAEGGVVYHNDSMEGNWEIKDITPGIYTLHGQILDETYRNVITEEEYQFQIMPTVSIENMEVFLTADTAVLGETVETILKGTFLYKGNIDGTVHLKTEIKKNEEIIDNKEKTVEIQKTQEEYQTELLTFTPDTTEEGSYQITVQLYYESELLKEAETTFTVRKDQPNTKVNISQNMDKNVLYPGRDNLLVTFGLEGKQIKEQPQLSIQSFKTWSVQNLINNEEETNHFLYNNELLYNDYIELSTKDGNYSVGTREGDPETTIDNNKKLIYGHPGGHTSYVTLNIDDNISQYCPNVKGTTVDLERGSLLTEQLWNEKIRITQENTIISNPITGREDIVEMKYTISNEDTKKHNVGIRIMMDTQLGNNDSAPFRVPGIGGLINEKELIGEEIPQYYQVFDNLSNPSVVAQGTLYLDEKEKPDKVQFVNWRKATSNPWNCAVSLGGIGDSAVNVYWNPTILEAGETREYITYYGCGELNQGIEGNLATGVTGVTKLETADGEYAPNPFLVTAYTCNMGSSTMENVEGKIVLPEGLTLAEGEEETKNFGNLEAAGEAQNSWNVIAKPSIIDRNLVYSVIFSVNGEEIKTVHRKLFVPKLMDNLAARDIVLETTVESKYLSIDETKCNPIPQSIVHHENGTKTIRWELEQLVIDEKKDFCLGIKGEKLPSGENIIVTKNTKISYIDKNGNQRKERLENLSIPINQYAIDSKLVTDYEEYENDDIVVITDQTKNLREYETTLHGELIVYDEDGNIVETIEDSLEQTWSACEEKEIDYIWETDSYPAGKYTIKISWKEQEQVIAQSEAVCRILPNGEIQNKLTLDKTEYAISEKAVITNEINNISENHTEDNLKLTIKIVDSEGTKIKQINRDLESMLPDSIKKKVDYFDTASCKSGKYEVISSITQEEKILCTNKKEFTIKSAKETMSGIKGTIKVSSHNISPADKLDIKTTLTNKTNEILENIPTAIRIVKVSDQTELKRFEFHSTLETGETDTNTTEWAQSSLEEGEYLVIYEGITENETVIPLGTDYFKVSYIRDTFKEDTDMWNYMGDAYRSENGYAVLTHNKNHQKGAMWLKKGIYQPFVVNFQYKNGGGSGADGFVFMFGKKTNELGNEGREMGFKEGSGYGVEFDSFYNQYHGEHCGIHTRHIAFIKDKLSTGEAGEIIKPLAVNLEKKFADKIGDNQWHDVEIHVKENGVEVFVDGEHAIQYKGKIQFDFDGFGFSAATGTENDNHYIDNVVIRENTTIKSKAIEDDFVEDTGMWNYMGSASHSTEGYAVLTENKDWQAGAMWLNQVVSAPYNAKFKYKAGGGNNADGLVFMFGKNRNQIGENGGGLGFASGNGYGVEFDSFYNGNQGEHNANQGKHIALVKDRLSSNYQGEIISSLDLCTDQNVTKKVNDNKWHDVEVQVRKDGVTVYLDGDKILSWKGNMDKNYSGLGFAAATGGYTQYHYIDDVRIEENINTVVEEVSDDFTSDTGYWNYMGNASYENNGYARLTEKRDWTAGAMWLKKEIGNRFTTKFDFKMEQGSGLADGFTYMFYKKENELGDVGQSMGFAENSGYGIEFDNFYNGSGDEKIEKDSPHISLVKNSTKGYASVVLAFNNDEKVIKKLTDNQWHTVLVEVYEDQVIVLLDGEKIIDWTGELDTSNRFTGFSGATGGVNQSHMIDNFYCRIER